MSLPQHSTSSGLLGVELKSTRVMPTILTISLYLGEAPPYFSNHFDDMRWINGEVERLNMESGIKVPNFTTFGLRVGNHSTKDKYGYVHVNHTTTHRRETDYREMYFIGGVVLFKTKNFTSIFTNTADTGLV